MFRRTKESNLVNNTKAGTLNASDQNALETECAEGSKSQRNYHLENLHATTIKEPFSSPRRHLLIHYRWNWNALPLSTAVYEQRL